ALGDYQPLEVSGSHRDHIVAFARRRGKSAAVGVAGRLIAPFTQGGRSWPKADAIDAAVDVPGYTDEGDADDGHAIHGSALYRPLPSALLKASVVSAARPARKKAIA